MLSRQYIHKGNKNYAKLWKRRHVNNVSLLLILRGVLPKILHSKKAGQNKGTMMDVWKIFKIPSSKDHGMPLEELQKNSADTRHHEMGQKKAIKSLSKKAASRFALACFIQEKKGSSV